MRALAPIRRLVRRKTTTGFAPRDRQEKRIRGAACCKNERNKRLDSTQRDAKNKSARAAGIAFALH